MNGFDQSKKFWSLRPSKKTISPDSRLKPIVPKRGKRGSDRSQKGSLLTSWPARDFRQNTNHSTLPRTTRSSREFNPQNVTLPPNDGFSHFGSVAVHATTSPLSS